MAQASPTNLLLAQAVFFINRLRREYSIRKFKASEEVIEAVEKALTNFEDNAGKSLIPYDPIFPSEVPNSGKMNRFWSALQFDVNALQDQVDLLRASAIDTHNFIEVEIKKARADNLRAQNKLKTLELYSNVNDASLVYFGDTFITEDLIDWGSMSADENRLTLLGKGAIGLSVEKQENALEGYPEVKILDGSNGFLGNWNEIMDPTEFFVVDSVTGAKSYYFKSEIYAANDTEQLLDSSPTTWIEFEKYFITETDRVGALNYNFHYKWVNDPQWKYLESFTEGNGLVNWADGLGSTGEDGSLILSFEIDMKAPQKSNIIKLLPFGLANNVNNPIKIKSVTTSLDRTVWYTLNPQNVWLANGIDRKLVEIDEENILVGEGTWATNGEPIRFVRFVIEQPRPINVKAGHLYYVLRAGGANGTTQATTRQLGPIPTLADPNEYLENSTASSDLTQRMEFFNAKRWVIGLRDIDIKNNVYHSNGTFVSQKFEIPGIIDRVALEAEVDIPIDYDQTEPWIRFFLSPNDGLDWYPISRIQDDFLGIPEIVAFNDPTPAALREPGVGYYDVDGIVNSLRLKVEMDRPGDKEYSTPILKPYKLKVKKRV